MNKQINALFSLIVVSFILTTIIACSSVKKTKTKSKEETKIEETVKSTVTETEKNTTESVTSTKGIITKDKIDILYEPQVDTFGNLIPFSMQKKDSKGNETVVNITGNAKVNYTSEQEDKDVTDTTKTEESKEKEKLENTVKSLEQKIERLESEKTKQPDYIKMIIWIAIGLFLLSGICIALYIYVKSQIGSIKKLLP